MCVGVCVCVCGRVLVAGAGICVSSCAHRVAFAHLSYAIYLDDLSYAPLSPPSLLSFGLYFSDRARRVAFLTDWVIRRKQGQLLREARKQQSLILNIIPWEIYRKLGGSMRRGRGSGDLGEADGGSSAGGLSASASSTGGGRGRASYALAELHPRVTVIFIQIERLALDMDPAVVLHILEMIVSHIDQICVKYGCEKIKTIGTTYMAASGVPLPVADHCQRIAYMALDVISSRTHLCCASVAVGVQFLRRAGNRVRQIVCNTCFGDRLARVLNIPSRSPNPFLSPSSLFATIQVPALNFEINKSLMDEYPEMKLLTPRRMSTAIRYDETFNPPVAQQGVGRRGGHHDDAYDSGPNSPPPARAWKPPPLLRRATAVGTNPIALDAAINGPGASAVARRLMNGQADAGVGVGVGVGMGVGGVGSGSGSGSSLGGLGMNAHLKHLERRRRVNIDVRIGINSGPVVAGVIGRYPLFCRCRERKEKNGQGRGGAWVIWWMFVQRRACLF